MSQTYQTLVCVWQELSCAVNNNASQKKSGACLTSKQALLCLELLHQEQSTLLHQTHQTGRYATTHRSRRTEAATAALSKQNKR